MESNEHRRRPSQLTSPESQDFNLKPEDPPPAPASRISANSKTMIEVYPNMYKTILAILSWYFCSTVISVYNKWMFTGDKLGFSFPIIITSFHQVILTLLSLATLWLFPSLRLNYNGYKSLNGDESAVDPEEELSYIPPFKEYMVNIFPCSFSSALDIGLGNMAIRFIPLAIFTMVKTSSLLFVLFWGVLFRLEKLTKRILIIVLIMTGGVICMMWGQTGAQDLKEEPSDKLTVLLLVREMVANNQLVSLGIVLVFTSACFSGLRWALTQLILKKNKRTKNPILTIIYLSPGMAVILFLLGLKIEGFTEFLLAPIWSIKGKILTTVLILIPGILAFLMTISEFILLQNASLLTLSIAGIFKELLTIFFSWLIFGDLLNWVNILGLVITISDIMWYNQYRFNQNEKNILNKQEVEELDEPFVDIEMENFHIQRV